MFASTSDESPVKSSKKVQSTSPIKSGSYLAMVYLDHSDRGKITIVPQQQNDVVVNLGTPKKSELAKTPGSESRKRKSPKVSKVLFADDEK